MMYGFGDCKKPLLETAALVEEIVHQQITAMIYRANDVAVIRGDKQISIEDILFLLRKDRVKLKRLLKYYEVRDLKNVLKSSISSGDDSKVDPAAIQFQEKVMFDKKLMSRNRQICYEFLSSIDQTGELVSLFTDTEVDSVKHERMLRAELQSQGMDTQQYFEFCQARQVSFSRGYNKSQHFREWLQLKLTPDIVVNPNLLEIFSYLAYETVVQVVDLALLVKQDMRSPPGDYLAKTRPPLCINYSELYANSIYNKPDSGSVDQNSSTDILNQTQLKIPVAGNLQLPTGVAQNKLNKKKKKKSDPPTSVEVSWDSTILPSDVREAMRRYYTDIGPFASQLKLNYFCSSWYNTLSLIHINCSFFILPTVEGREGGGSTKGRSPKLIISKMGVVNKVCLRTLYTQARQYSRDERLSTFSYWKSQYQRKTQDIGFDWFLDSQGVLTTILDHLKQVTKSPSYSCVEEDAKRSFVSYLDLGCGTSSLSLEVLKNSPHSMLQVLLDFVPEALTYQMANLTNSGSAGKEKTCVGVCADVQKLPFASNTFNVIVDKGTMDALMKDRSHGHHKTRLMLSEVMRVLASGGRYLQISDEDPDSRLLYLDQICSSTLIDNLSPDSANLDKTGHPLSSWSFQVLSSPSGIEYFVYWADKKL
ncbi:Transcription initiation protein SPT3 [Bulinus truncatus]|nr:Transcription initiation protein SPT3 [Bulinus truncatus]